ncbi:MAG TPA: YcgN family cysteine cluster protein [Hyphomicrobiales bacterium]|nr:YcgN family cysteine cluster protein [Hyphomicrobiales bacterium]
MAAAPLCSLNMSEPFWKTKKLEEMTATEWESLCDGCGQCCLIKLEDDDTGDIAVTRLACKLLDLGSCRCSDYQNRQQHVPDCVKLTPESVSRLRWLPESCAYRLLDEGRELRWWHPLVSGTQETVHEAGISIRGAAISEKKVSQERFPAHIVSWISRKRA